MGVAPIGAIKKVLDRTGMTIGDIDVVELNEAFAAQVIPIMAECDIPLEKLNTHGGAIALGHPFGMTGARIMTTLLNVMETDDHAVGLETDVRRRRPGRGDGRRAPELMRAHMRRTGAAILAAAVAAMASLPAVTTTRRARRRRSAPAAPAARSAPRSRRTRWSRACRRPVTKPRRPTRCSASTPSTPRSSCRSAISIRARRSWSFRTRRRPRPPTRTPRRWSASRRPS